MSKRGRPSSERSVIGLWRPHIWTLCGSPPAIRDCFRTHPWVIRLELSRCWKSFLARLRKFRIRDVVGGADFRIWCHVRHVGTRGPYFYDNRRCWVCSWWMRSPVAARSLVCVVAGGGARTLAVDDCYSDCVRVWRAGTEKRATVPQKEFALCAPTHRVSAPLRPCAHATITATEVCHLATCTGPRNPGVGSRDEQQVEAQAPEPSRFFSAPSPARS